MKRCLFWLYYDVNLLNLNEKDKKTSCFGDLFIFKTTSFPLCLVILIGVSIDLVCLAEQPLHTVPLLKYINKVLSQGDANLGDDYNIPHWMNHGFYTSPERRNKKENFVPRIKVPDVVLSSLGRCGGNEKGTN